VRAETAEGENMKTVSFKEYEEAKREIIGGVQYKEHSELEGGRISKQYATEENGIFYEITENGITEFWSDKHPESRRYDDRTREEIIVQYEEIICRLQKERNRLIVEKNTYQKAMNENADMVSALSKTNVELKEKLAAINALVA
jgi:hypothetical protein